MRYVLALIIVLVMPVYAIGDSTVVPGQQKWDSNGNGYPDAGVIVNGHYNSYYYYDANDDWYWDLGDGRTQGTVVDPGDLDQETLTTCVYQVNYRGDFNDDPYQDTGWIMNEINCSGYESGAYSYLIVNESDPRYTGNPDWSVWGNWEYHVLAGTGFGNLVRPDHYTP